MRDRLTTADVMVRLGAAGTALFGLTLIFSRDTQSSDYCPLTYVGSGVTAGQSDVAEFYPQLAQNGFFPREYSCIQTSSRIPTEFFNSTKYDLNLKTARKIYDHFENLVKEPRVIHNYLFEGQKHDLVYSERGAKARSLIFVPNGAPKPAWDETGINTRQLVAATRNTPDLHRISFVEAAVYLDEEFGGDLEGQLVFGTAVEICQEVVVGRFVDKSGMLMNDLRVARAAQEVVCNSLGRAIGARISGFTYERYLSLFAGQSFALKDVKGQLAFVILGRAEYEALPVFEPLTIPPKS